VEEIITASKVAALLKIHVQTVYRLSKIGLIPGNRVGRSWRFNKRDILDLISNKQRKSSTG
jgi:excisionase family DNA binding protein